MRRFPVFALCAALAGCFSSGTVTTRHFVLASVPAMNTNSAGNIRLGLRVAMPEYLLAGSIAVRQSANEIRYLETAFWAERLDKDFQRVLAEDLSEMIPAGQIRQGAWRADDVTLEVHVAVEQFDVDKAGTGNLVAGWRITSPGGGKILKSGTSRSTKSGKNDPQGLVTTMSDLTTDFSRALAQAIQDVQAGAGGF